MTVINRLYLRKWILKSKHLTQCKSLKIARRVSLCNILCNTHTHSLCDANSDSNACQCVSAFVCTLYTQNVDRKPSELKRKRRRKRISKINK